jgi:predicted PurR-regulated permease PerM
MSDTNPNFVNLWSIRRIIAASLAVSGVLGLFLLVYLCRGILLLLFIAIVLATAIKPLIGWLEEKIISHYLSVIIAYGFLALLLLSAIVVAAPLALDQITGLATAIPESYENLRERALHISNPAVHWLAASLPSNPTFPKSWSGESQAPLEQGKQTLYYFGLGVKVLLGSWATLLLAFYWSLQEDRVMQWFLLALPFARREGAKEVVATMLSKIGAFLRGQSILCLMVGGMAFLTYLSLGMPYAIVLGIVAGLCEAVPFFGPLLGFAPAVLVAASVDWQMAVSVIVAAIVIQQIENYLLAPRVMDKSVGVHPMVTLLAFVAFGTLFGVAGIILAIPMAAVIQVAVEHFLLRREALEPAPPSGRNQKSILHYQAGELLKDIRLLFREKNELATKANDRLEELIESIVQDIELAFDEEPSISPPSRLVAETAQRAEVRQ